MYRERVRQTKNRLNRMENLGEASYEELTGLGHILEELEAIGHFRSYDQIRTSHSGYFNQLNRVLCWH